jgi:hypothetical protein
MVLQEIGRAFQQAAYSWKKNDHTNQEIKVRENGAGNGARTRGIKLGKLALYQLSYARSVK